MEIGRRLTLFRVPAAQRFRASIPRLIMQIPVFVRPHDVVHAERPQVPPQHWLERVLGVGVEQPPATHVVHLGAVGGHDVLVRGALGAADEPSVNRRASKRLSDYAPEEIYYVGSLSCPGQPPPAKSSPSNGAPNGSISFCPWPALRADDPSPRQRCIQVHQLGTCL